MTIPVPIEHPLGPPVINGDGTIAVPDMLREPDRITRFIMDITRQRFLLERLFTRDGGVTGGAVIFDQAQYNDLYLDRDLEMVAPGSEFPLVTSSRRQPKIAEVEKWGGKFWFSHEARDRNDQSGFQRQLRMLGNTVVRKLNQRAIEVTEAAIASTSGDSTFVGHVWASAIPNGSNPTAPSSTPAADFAKAQLLSDTRELGLNYDLLVTNPLEANTLRMFYGGNLAAVLSDNGINEMYVTNRMPAGQAYMVASNAVGSFRVEQPLGTETEEEGFPLRRQRTWVQSSVRPLMFADNPYAVIKITGLEG